ncbi:hypothetical protein C2845_PM01G47460 [Panicum miliaceum]|uniref:Uncharacterized protein n=1 Tax=Panicum miliaceum TaxID=4540 RepID=A0A3L6TG56_PANMI|nr:hypothetical protein C2845_PM01G47460 [Panicum miliaceum]
MEPPQPLHEVLTLIQAVGEVGGGPQVAGAVPPGGHGAGDSDMARLVPGMRFTGDCQIQRLEVGWRGFALDSGL